MEDQMHMQLPIFNGEDHEIWCIKMITLLMSRGLWDVVKTGVEPLANRSNLQDLILKDMKALHMLQMSVTRSVFFKIAKATSSKHAWEILCLEYEETNEFQRMKDGYLHTKFNETMMSDEESVSDYIDKLMEIANEIRYYESKLSDSEIVNKIIRHLPSRFNMMVCAIHRNDKKLTLTQVVYKLREYELYLFKSVESRSSRP